MTAWSSGAFPRPRTRARPHVNYRRRAKRHGVDYEHVQFDVVQKRDRGRCQLCRRTVPTTRHFPDPMSATLDHVIPMAKGGGHLYANVQLAHLKCNVEKGVGGSQQLALI